MNIDQLLNSPFSFRERKTFIPCETRPLWKIALILVIIDITGRDNRASLKKIHTANWLLKDPAHLDEIISWSQSELLFSPLIRLDPTIDRAIELLSGYGYATKTDGRISLTPRGIELSKVLIKESIMQAEIAKLKAAKKYLSDTAIDRIFKAS